MPTISFVGIPSASGLDDFTLMGSGMLNNSFGVLVWSTAPGNIPLGGGTLCLSGPFYRNPAQFSGGTLGTPGVDCSGTLQDFMSQAWFAQNSLMIGTSVYVQYVSRDQGFAPPNNYSLSDGLRFTIQ